MTRKFLSRAPACKTVRDLFWPEVRDRILMNTPNEPTPTPTPPADPDEITAEQDALIREVVVRHVSNLVEELTVRNDIVPHISLTRRGLVGLTLASYVAAHSIGETLGRSGMLREDAEGALAHLVDQTSEQFAVGHVTGMAANQPGVPETPPA